MNLPVSLLGSCFCVRVPLQGSVRGSVQGSGLPRVAAKPEVKSISAAELSGRIDAFLEPPTQEQGETLVEAVRSGVVTPAPVTLAACPPTTACVPAIACLMLPSPCSEPPFSVMVVTA